VGRRLPEEEEMASELAQCKRCSATVGDALHPCPYQAEQYGDAEPYCNCCADCEAECKDSN
jgi:hypothetical protein